MPRDVRARVTPNAISEPAVRLRPRDMLGELLGRQAALADIAQLALLEDELTVLLAETARLVSRVLRTELVSIAEVTPAGDLRVMAGEGWRDDIVGRLVVGAETGSQSGYTLTVDEPVVVTDLRRETRFRVLPALLEHGAVAGLSARIGGADRPYGVLSAWTTHAGSFRRDDANFLQVVANVLAGAVRRLAVEAELRTSRDELRAIVGSAADGILLRGRDGRLLFANESAARMNHFPTPEALLTADPRQSESRYTVFDEDGEPLADDRLPSRVALTTGRQTPERLVRVVWHDSGEEFWHVLQATPLVDAEGNIDRVIVVVRDVTEQRRQSDNRQFLTEALASLSATLDHDDAAQRLARLCVPRLGDYAAIDLLDIDGSVVPAALSHVEPEAAALGWRLRRQRGWTADSATVRVLREGRSELARADTLPAETAERPREPAAAQLLSLGLTSWLRVPLLGRGRSIGVLTVGRTRADKALDDHDLALAQELGARAGVALENARLFATARDRRAELDAVLAAMSDAVLVFDASGRLRLTNRAAEELFALDPPRTVERLHELVEHADVPAGRAPNGPAQRDRDALAELEGEVQLAGSGRWYELRRYRSRRTSADRGERHGPFVVVLRDVTETRAARAARDAFLGVLSHELRTPITTIYGGSELLERELSDAQRADIVRDIRAESERLARLVEDLLVMTRVERGAVEIGDEPVLMQRLVPAVAGALRNRVPGLRIGLDVQDNLPAVRGEATYLEQVLRNLLTNAVRYGEGQERGIDVVAEAIDDRVYVRVRDSGPGLAGEDPERLFDLFYRSPAAKSVPGGAGIGLFVCRRLAEAMGGGVEASARPERGAEFSLYLPIVDPDPD